MSRLLQFEAGARMILDAILLTIADISLHAKEKLPVEIFPEMRIASGDGVLVKNTVNQFEVWLTGNVDYGVCTYKHEANRGTTCLINFLLNVTSTIFPS
jgi:hypothetical protein